MAEGKERGKGRQKKKRSGIGAKKGGAREEVQKN